MKELRENLYFFKKFTLFFLIVLVLEPGIHCYLALVLSEINILIIFLVHCRVEEVNEKVDFTNGNQMFQNPAFSLGRKNPGLTLQE